MVATLSKCLGIITARGGSKRIPRKNIKEFCGKPIISYSITAALESKIFDQVMVSTDDVEIGEISKKYGATIPFFRSEKTANDIAATHEVLLEVLSMYENMGEHFDYICCIYPTAPFVTSDKLKTAMDMLISQDLSTVLPIVPFSFPLQRGFVLRDKQVKFMYPEHEFTRSQDLETIYHDCGQFYCLKVSDFLEEQRLVMKKAKPIIVSELEAQDIDNEDDWKLAEIKYRKMLEKNKVM